MVLSFSINKDVVKDHLDNNFSLLGRSILRIITNYLNAYLNTGCYRFGPDKLPGLVIALSSTHGCSVWFFSPISSFYQSSSTCMWWCFQNASASLNHLSSTSGYLLRFYCFFTDHFDSHDKTDPHCYREGKGHIYHGNSYRSF